MSYTPPPPNLDLLPELSRRLLDGRSTEDQRGYFICLTNEKITRLQMRVIKWRLLAILLGFWIGLDSLL